MPRPVPFRFLLPFFLAGFGPLLPAAGAADVRITFLPPPLEGTLSVGVYTAEGKLVRTLAQEAPDDRFVAGLNGFIMSWDGKDDAGRVLPAGKYFVRGFAVGDLEVEGEAFHGNDWVEDEDAPHLRELSGLRAEGRKLLIGAVLATGGMGVLRVDLDSGKSTFTAGETAPAAALEAAGREASQWRIEAGDQPAGGARSTLVQRQGDEILRELELDPAEPQPGALAVAADRDELYLLERNSTEIRLRALRLKETKAARDGQPAVSAWEVFLQKSIRAQETFAGIQAHLGRPQPPVAADHLRVALMPNELLPVAPAALQVVVAHDEKGSLLRTAEGLPLRRLTDTPGLRWTALSREPGGVVALFQSDGAVVEEYRLRNLEHLMAFDAGEYQWTGGQ